MSVTAKLRFLLDVTLASGDRVKLGSLATDYEMTLTTGVKFETTVVVADNYTAKTLWQIGQGGMDTFEALFILSDVDVLLELRNVAATDEFALIEVKANVPMFLTPANLRATASGTTVVGDGSGTGTTTTLKACDQVVVQNDVADSVGDATVQLVLFA